MRISDWSSDVCSSDLVCAQQIVMGSLFTPPESRDWFGADQPDTVRRRVEVAQLAAKARLPLNMDSWDGYPAARSRLLAARSEESRVGKEGVRPCRSRWSA